MWREEEKDKENLIKAKELLVHEDVWSVKEGIGKGCLMERRRKIKTNFEEEEEGVKKQEN